MRAVKGKDKVLNLINNFEAKIFELVKDSGWVDTTELQERELYMAEDMYVRNVLQKVKKGSRTGFSTYPQKEQV